MGEQKTPRPFVSACDRFCYIDNILKSQSDTKTQKKKGAEDASQEKGDKSAKGSKPKSDKPSTKSAKTPQKPQETPKTTSKPHDPYQPISALDAVDSLIADAASDDTTSVTDIDTITDAISAIVDEMMLDDDDGWVLLSDVGNVLRKRYPDFDQRNYGYSKMTTFIAGLDIFEMRKVVEDPQNPKSAVIYMRNKSNG